MTTRRDILAGMAGASLAPAVALAASSAALAATDAHEPAEQTQLRPDAPVLTKGTPDWKIMRELDHLARCVADMRKSLLAAQIDDPSERFGCVHDFIKAQGMTSIYMSFVQDEVPQLLREARADAKAAKAARLT